jgi:hypothetical protein
MNVSSVSPDLWLAITPQPAALDILTASMDSDTVPIWFTCTPHKQGQKTKRAKLNTLSPVLCTKLSESEDKQRL